MQIDQAVQAFLDLDRLAVVGVSRAGDSPANAIARRLRETEHQVFAVNPSAVQGVVVVTRPEQAREVAAQAAAAGAEWIWFHQGFGPVSFDDETLRIAHDAGLKVISAGCPMMYCCPDGFHRCARAVFRLFGRIPGEIEV